VAKELIAKYGHNFALLRGRHASDGIPGEVRAARPATLPAESRHLPPILAERGSTRKM